MNTHRHLQIIAAVVLLVCAGSTEARTWHVDALATGEQTGDEAAPFATINQAAALAEPGDTVLVRPGVYREWVRPRRGGTAEAPVVYRSAQRHAAVVRGSFPLTGAWQVVPEMPGVMRCAIPTEGFVDPDEPGSAYRAWAHLLDMGPLPRDIAARPWTPGDPPPPFGRQHMKNRNMADGAELDVPHSAASDNPANHRFPFTTAGLYVGGEPMLQVDRFATLERSAGTWMVSPEGTHVWLHPPDTERVWQDQVELATRQRLFAPIKRDLGHIHVVGFTFEQCANPGPYPQGGAVSVRSGHHWLIQDNLVRHATTIGIDIGSETWRPDIFDDRIVPTSEQDRKIIIAHHHTVRGNTITHNGLNGIAGWNNQHARIVGNRIMFNNSAAFREAVNANWEGGGGIKVHAFGHGLIEGNLVAYNNTAGIWLDNGFKHARVTRNLVIGNVGSGIFVELGFGPVTVDHNIIAHTAPDPFFGDGIYTHDASEMLIAHNLIAHNAGAGINSRIVSDRTVKNVGTVEASDIRVLNNLFAGRGTALNLPLPSDRARNNHSDHNAYLRHPTFSLHRNAGRVSPQAFVGFFQQNADKTSGPWFTPQSISLPNWQSLMQWDTHSQRLDARRFVVNPNRYTLATPGFATAPKPTAQRIDGHERDYFNQPRPSGNVYPGPFATWPEPPVMIPLDPTSFD